MQKLWLYTILLRTMRNSEINAEIIYFFIDSSINEVYMLFSGKANATFMAEIRRPPRGGAEHPHLRRDPRAAHGEEDACRCDQVVVARASVL